MLCGNLTQTLQVVPVRRDQAHIPGDRLQDDARHIVGVRLDDRFHYICVVERDDDGVLRELFRHARTRRHTERRRARPCLNQQVVAMPVITPGDFNDLVAPREPPRDADRAHRRLRAGVDESHLVHRRVGVEDERGEFDFSRRARAETRPPMQRLLNRLRHGGVSVPQDQRTP